MQEFEQKQARLQALLEKDRLGALLLQRVSSFAWATCGAASYVNTAATEGASSVLITRTGHYLLTNNIEATRLEQEERLADQGWQFHIAPWHQATAALESLSRGLDLGADGPYPGARDVSLEVARLRANLTPEEGDRFRELGQLCAQAMVAATQAIRPGQTELQIAGRLALEAEARGVQAIVNLIAVDDRVFKFRHPLPTTKPLEHYAMLVLCGRRKGLVCSLTRFVHFGRLPEELRLKSEAVARVDAALMAATRPGRGLGEILQRGVTAYAEVGYPEEWRDHHQGGMAGYEPRELIATPGSTETVILGQAYAWNPSIRGTKSEDSILVSQAGPEILTAIEDWPVLDVSVGGYRLPRPMILELT